MYEINCIPWSLKFIFDARTSRGAIRKKETLLLKITDKSTGIIGWGECSVIKGLSADGAVDYPELLTSLETPLQKIGLNNQPDLFKELGEIVPEKYSALRTGLETAFSDILFGGGHKIFEGTFYQGLLKIPINGLVWMGDYDFMLQQVEEKVAQGFSCIKIKVGALDFDSELRLLAHVRQKHGNKNLTLRLDANGAFTPEEVMKKLMALSKFDIHSIEQPVKPGLKKTLTDLSKSSPIPIALDEEMIGITGTEDKMLLLNEIRPNYLVLKPSLHGGFASTAEWITLAKKLKIGWWVTSALESDIGLNAIAQFTGQYNPFLHQGLGTGKLYSNNLPSPLTLKGGAIEYDVSNPWDLRPLSS